MVVWGIIQWTHRTPGKEKGRLLFHPAMVDFYLGLPGFYFGVAWYVSYLSLKIPQQNSNKLPSHRIPLEKKQVEWPEMTSITHTHTKTTQKCSAEIFCRYLVSAPRFLETYHLFICWIWNHLDVGGPCVVATLFSGDLSISFEQNRNWQYFRNQKGSLLESGFHFLQ